MRILYVHPENAVDAAADLLEGLENLEMCASGADFETKLRELSHTGAAPQIVVIGPGVPRPLSVARAARDAHPQVGLAIVASADQVGSVAQKLALSPQISDAAVIAVEEDLRHQIRQVADEARRRYRTQDALDEMNLELRQRQLDRRLAPPQQSVSDHHLSALTRHAPDAIISVDTTGAVASWNRAATTIFGYDADETEGALLSDLLSPEGEPVLDRIIEAAAEGAAQDARDLELRREDGTGLTASVTAAPVRDRREQVAGVVLMLRDVTHQRRTEEQLRHLQKAQSMATLAGGVAHDFNNLLVSVQGWAELALEEPDDDTLVRQALQQIGKSAGQAGALARQMLAYSGRTELTLQPLDLNEVVADMTGLLRSSISRKIDLVTVLDPALPPVEADATQLRQIVMNLVTNAAEAIGDDTGRIEVRTSSREVDRVPVPGPRPYVPPGGSYVVLTVADTGRGMDAATIQRIFEPFFTTKFTGRGLGLAAALGIAQALGGTILVESEPGAGAEFRLLLPTEENH